FSIPSTFETACVQILMDVDMLWHYTVEGETIEQARQRVWIGKTPAYSFIPSTPKEAKILQWLRGFHAEMLDGVEEVLRSKMQLAEIIEKTLEDVTYASMRRGLQELYYITCRRGVWFRLTEVDHN
ncbi:MAG: hypothetical protein CML61_06760, partial [Rhodobacteraceae bacterium]|nr:hypothetical protein [Paracoccaceae bacterium]